MAKLKGLGRGLDALLAGNDTPAGDAQAELAVGMLKPGRFQPRTRMDPQSIAELADSIKVQGLLQPINVLRQLVDLLRDRGSHGGNRYHA